MKKWMIWTLSLALILLCLAGCQDKSNVSDAKDGSVTSGTTGDRMEDLSEMISEILTEEETAPAGRIGIPFSGRGGSSRNTLQ